MGTAHLTESEEKILRKSLLVLHNKLSEAEDMRDYLKKYNRSLTDPSPFNAYNHLTVKEHLDSLKTDIKWYKEQINKHREIWKLNHPSPSQVRKESRPVLLYSNPDPIFGVFVCNICGRVFQSEIHCIYHIKVEKKKKISLTSRIVR